MEKAKDCIFCKMIRGEIPAPQAKTHLLVMPKKHITSLETAFPRDGIGQEALIGRLFLAATQIAREQGLLPGGFRSVINTNRDGGQTVFHLHLHILGGEILREVLV